MPRLQTARRTSLLCTNLKNAFLDGMIHSARSFWWLTRRPLAFTRHVCSAEGILVMDLCGVARRVQTDLQQVTGHFCPLFQVMASIHDLRKNEEGT